MTESGEKEKDKFPVIGEKIRHDGKKFKLVAAIGDGGFGQVFESLDGETRIAVKTEKYSKSMLHIEVKVLKSAATARAKHFCELFGYGSNKPLYVYMMMTLLQKDLHKLRSEMPDRKFTFSTAIRLGIQTLEAIKELHEMGFLSRDIKPKNFAPGYRDNRQHRTIYMYDFGLARKYLDKNNNVIPSRKKVGWRGTTRYGSLQAHLRQDLGRKDDLESWLYMLVEMTRGTLPWRNVTDRSAVHAAKESARDSGRVEFLFEAPKQYDVILSQIDALHFESAPKYDKLLKLLKSARDDKNVKMDDLWDWEDEVSTTTNTDRSEQYDVILSQIDALQFESAPECDKLMKVLESDWEDAASTTTITVPSFSDVVRLMANEEDKEN